MNEIPLLALIGPAILTIIFALVKAGFLIWVFIRTQKVPALCYAIYVFLASVGGLLAPALLAQVFAASNPATFHSVLSTYGALSALLEIVLFIWLVRSLLRSPRPRSPQARSPQAISPQAIDPSPSDAAL